MPSAAHLTAPLGPHHYLANRPARWRGLAVVGLAHVLLLALLVSLEVLPLPAPMQTLMVEVLTPAAAQPVAAPTPPRPAERQPTPRPQPRAPQAAAPTLAAQTAAPSSAVAAPPVKESAPAVVAAPAPSAPAQTQARFDADYLQNPAPAYPPLARRFGEEGKVLLRVFVEPGGRPSQVEIKSSSGSPRLDQAAQEAVWRWKFVPARRGDEAVGAWVQVPIVFNLRG
jgi:protein TonB